MNFIERLCVKFVTETVIRRALVKSDRFTWEDEDQKNLAFFFTGGTGTKTMAQLEANLQNLMNSAVSEGNRELSLHKLAVAKGFALAIGAIKLSMPEPFKSEEVIKVENDPFAFTHSQPVNY